jgi:di/tricarboxylate transporter
MSILFLLAVVLLLVGKIIPVDVFLGGFSNQAILTIFLLIIITSSINQHFNLFKLLDRIFDRVKSPRFFILKMGGVVAIFSSLINNTTVVATMMPYVYNWGNEKGISPSKLLMPLSFAAIVGGMITLIGTSTNLLLNGLLNSNGFEALVFTDFLFPGLFVSFLVILFLFFFGASLLNHSEKEGKKISDNVREYLVETKVLKGSSIISLSIEGAQLRNLDGVFLAEIIRNKKHLLPVSPIEIIEEGDVFLFAGETSKIFSLLKKIDGLELQQAPSSLDDNVMEAVVAQNSTLDHKTLKEVGFREKYDAVIVGIHRKGERLSGKLGSIILRTGDLVLINGGNEFKEKNNRWQDLIVISTIFSENNISLKRRSTFLISLLIMVGLTLFGFVELFEGLLGLMFIQLLLGMIDFNSIKKNVSLDLLVVLTASLALGNALISSGASDFLVELLFANVESWSPDLLLIGLFAFTFLLTSFITNVAALAIIFPVVANISGLLPIPDEALFLTIAFGASCSFLTPFAYQTNLMVAEAGNYRMKDFLKLGLPLSLVYASGFFIYLFYRFDL